MERIATGYDHIEGPRLGPDGSLYFSDSSNINRIAPDGTIEVFYAGRGSGGIAVHADGGLVVGGPDIARLVDGRLELVFADPEASMFNDFFTDELGRVYAGTVVLNPEAPEDYARTLPGRCLRIEGRNRGEPLYGNVGFTNGIGFSPDGATLYHVDTFRDEVIVHRLEPDGSVTARPRLSTTDAPGHPDGLAVDEDGCFWTGMYGGSCIARFTPEGNLDQIVDVPDRNVTSLTFGGSDRRDMYVVTSDDPDLEGGTGSVYLRRARAGGLPVFPARV